MINTESTLRVVELFSGTGSQTQALKNLGIPHKVVAISDIDKFADKSYRALHGEMDNLGDIKTIAELPPADLWTYSFPCQDISVAGKGAGLDKGHDTRSGLLWEVERLLLRAKETNTLPKYLLLENVKNLIGKKHKANYDAWIAFLDGLGYTTYTKVLNAKNYGVPQNRERVFGVSILGEHEPYLFPEPVPLTRRLKDILEDEVDPRFYLKESTIRSILNSKYNSRRDDMVHYGNEICKALRARDHHEPKCVVVGQVEGEKWSKTMEMHQRVYSPDGVSPTITANGGGNQEKKILTDPQIEVVGQMVGGKWETSYALSRQVYDPEGIAPTQVAAAGAGGNNETKIIVDDLYPNRVREYHETCPTLRSGREGFKVVAMRGRNPENPSDRTPGIPTQQRLEPRKDDLTNTITTCQKDNLVMYNQYNDRIIGDVAPTQTTNCGNVTSSAQVLQIHNCTIRKLTPTECWRLMGWADEQIAKVKAVTSNAQMYKQAGNGIVVQVLEAIFKNLFMEVKR